MSHDWKTRTIGFPHTASTIRSHLPCLLQHLLRCILGHRQCRTFQTLISKGLRGHRSIRLLLLPLNLVAHLSVAQSARIASIAPERRRRTLHLPWKTACKKIHQDCLHLHPFLYGLERLQIPSSYTGNHRAAKISPPKSSMALLLLHYLLCLIYLSSSLLLL